MSKTAILVKNVSKEYTLGVIGSTTLREELQRKKERRLKKDDPNIPAGYEHMSSGQKFKALDDVSFCVRQGERLGIIGRNGAGKSTVLKLITRITRPSEGCIGINGRIASMLEIGTGFHGELTGRENIYMNGAILGMSRKEIDEKIDSIVEFSEIGEFIDTPVKRYSSGMFVRLAFSVAVHLDADIVIMDEVLAVGDAEFQKKCINKMNEIVAVNNRTVLFVSHNMDTIRKMCDRCIVLEKGRLIFDGDVESAIDLYSHQTEISPGIISTEHISRRIFRIDNALRVEEIEIIGKTSAYYEYNETQEIKLRCTVERPLHNVWFAFPVYSDRGTKLGTVYSDGIDELEAGEKILRMQFNLNNLLPGRYSLWIIAKSEDQETSAYNHDVVQDAVQFEIVHSERPGELVPGGDYKWSGPIRFDNAKVIL